MIYYNIINKKGNIMDTGYTGCFRGKDIICVSDNVCEKIIIPETLANYILYLQNIEREYRQQQLNHLFDNLKNL